MKIVENLRFLIHIKDRYAKIEEEINDLTEKLSLVLENDALKRIDARIDSLVADKSSLSQIIQKGESDRRWAELCISYSEWWTFGATDSLIHKYHLQERFDVFWENSLPDYWLIYVSCLLERYCQELCANSFADHVKMKSAGNRGVL